MFPVIDSRPGWRRSLVFFLVADGPGGLPRMVADPVSREPRSIVIPGFDRSVVATAIEVAEPDAGRLSPRRLCSRGPAVNIHLRSTLPRHDTRLFPLGVK